MIRGATRIASNLEQSITRVETQNQSKDADSPGKVIIFGKDGTLKLVVGLHLTMRQGSLQLSVSEHDRNIHGVIFPSHLDGR